MKPRFRRLRAHGQVVTGAAVAAAETLPPRISVKVVDAVGAPIAGAKVTGQYPKEPTSTTIIPLGPATTDTDGTAVLRGGSWGAKGTDTTVEITASFRDWPARPVRFAGDAPEVHGKAEVRVVLGPAR